MLSCSDVSDEGKTAVVSGEGVRHVMLWLFPNSPPHAGLSPKRTGVGTEKRSSDG